LAGRRRNVQFSRFAPGVEALESLAAPSRPDRVLGKEGEAAATQAYLKTYVEELDAEPDADPRPETGGPSH